MRRVRRFKLSEATAAKLRALQTEVDQTKRADRKAKADQLWASGGAEKVAALQEVRTKLKRMCSGLERCMYCEDSAGTDIDHFRPKSTYPRRAFRWRNYFLACSFCNSNQKRTAFPMRGGAKLLLKPTVDDPSVHFLFVPSVGHFAPLTEEGEETAKVLGLNVRTTLERGRRNAWVTLISHIRNHASADADERRRIETAIKEMQFRAVVEHFFTAALARQDTVPADVQELVEKSKDTWAWVHK